MNQYVLRVDAIICMSGTEYTSFQKELTMLRFCADLSRGSAVGGGNVGGQVEERISMLAITTTLGLL